MWIKHIILENFASVKVGMKVNRVEIDFSKRKNKICLLTAPNGTGKTSLLSTFTPFATLGNLDVRDSENLILVGKSGYKEITIMDGDTEYLIKHFYSPNKESHSVKSYIMRDGEELNINGNVRSFQAIVEHELGLELGFLKLIRLGNNVTNLLQLSATERKKFLSNLLQDLDVFLNHYKKLTDDARVLKQQISHVTDKIKKTGIEDLDKTKETLNYLCQEIDELGTKKEKLLQQSGKITHEIESVSSVELTEEKKEIVKKRRKLNHAIEKMGASKPLEYYLKLKDEVENDVSNMERDRSVLNTKKDGVLQILDRLYSEVESLNREIEKENSNELLQSAKEIYKKLTKEINEAAGKFKDFHPDYTKDEIEKLISSLINAQQLLDTAYEFGEEPIKRVVNLIRDKKNVENYINNGLLEYDRSNRDSSSLLHKLITGVDNIGIECDHKKCGLYHLWMEIHNLMREEEVVRNSNDTEEFYKYMNIAYQRIMRLLDTLKELKPIIERLPKERKVDFLSENIFGKIKKLKPIFDRSLYNVLLTEITEYERFQELCRKCDEAEMTYKLMKKQSNIGYLESRLDKAKDDIAQYRDQMDEIKAAIISYDMRIPELKDQKEMCEAIIESLTNIGEIDRRESEIDASLSRFSELLSQKSSISKEIYETDSLLTKRKNDEIYIRLSIENYKSLQKEMERYMKLYNENFYIKKSMSSKEGIPLEFINIYMSKIKETINELLDIVYDGDLMIDDFKINADEFRIPYIKDGYLIPDIVQASQGETAFLSISLSFALIAESILKYNIILLDEIDGALDDGKRKKFIAILEKLIDMIDAEQIFLISHNNLFSMYPVDIVSLNNEVDPKVQLANYIPVIK